MRLVKVLICFLLHHLEYMKMTFVLISIEPSSLINGVVIWIVFPQVGFLDQQHLPPWELVRNTSCWPGTVAHTCNPGTLGG